MNNLIREMKEICDVWVKMDGKVISYTQDEIHLIYDYISKLEQENINLREDVYIKKMSFPNKDKSFKELMEMPRYQELQEENQYLKSVNSFSKRKLYNMNKDRLDANLRLVKENKKLHNKIDKAIELIKDKTKIISLEEGGGLELCDYDIRDLLEILKGDVDE